ncbi:NAD(+)/NADH kinase [Leptotrichia sp. OH3620_COT-345]|uniref:NAD(+)/NADH kinase n=1 Tax=Leptotrichia sp. OH3620_COT-345 TaxID=2491048 RepID=UPI000F64F2D1|nr:NAD(+)/NADH kinase [Leptotrichia sp. OH3620_COT-345]RRD40051.1 NAD(+)/NADH kinase [Leptotrichia sp. OH3620_COT-345]
MEKTSKNSSPEYNKILNKVKKVKIIKNKFVKEELLTEFYIYMKKNKIIEVVDVKNADLIVSFGGDGTILIAAKETIKKDIPILAVNMGTVGYMAEIKPENAVEMLEKYERSQCIIDERAFLEIEYNDNIFYALNELLIIKGGLVSHLINVEVYSNSILVNKYRADGVIVATPTGSTAYSLSAGGSIVHPSLNAVSITPLLPQSLTARPIIVDGKDKLSFKVYTRDNDAHLNIDGSQCFHIKPSDKINAVLSQKRVKIIRTENSDYYNILREKLKWGKTL